MLENSWGAGMLSLRKCAYMFFRLISIHSEFKLNTIASEILIMNSANADCPFNITDEFYTSSQLSKGFYLLSILNLVIDSCLPVISVGGSTLLILAIFKFPHLREVPSNLLLTSQAVCDLLIGVFAQPLIAVRLASRLFGFADCLLQQNFLNALGMYVTHFLLYSSCLNLCLITVDRYVCITHPLGYQSLVTVKTALKAIIACWSLSVAFAAVPVFLTHKADTLSPVITSRAVACIPPLLLVFTTFFCYFKMTRIARRHWMLIRALVSDTNNPTKQDVKSTRTTLIMVGVVFLCYVPTTSAVLGLYITNNLALLEVVLPFLSTLTFLNSSINPLVYYVRCRRIRRYVWKVIKRK